MHYEIIPVGAFESNAILLWEHPSAAWVIDPGADADILAAALRKHGLTVGLYVLTHGHIDHLSALGDLQAAAPAPVAVHPADAAWAFTEKNRFPPYVNVPPPPAEIVPGIADGKLLAVGGLEATVLHTPGHSPGCICLHVAAERLLVSGDTLFAGSVGRTDFPGGSWRQLVQSLQRLASLPDETVVLPGHGPTTTIGREKRTNRFLTEQAG